MAKMLGKVSLTLSLFGALLWLIGCGSDGASGADDDVDGGDQVVADAGPGDDGASVSPPDAGDPPPLPDRVWVVPWEADICPGKRLQLKATGIYESDDGETQLDITAWVTWSSDAPTVISISDGGEALGLDPGDATITATYGSASDTADLTVVPDQVAGLLIQPASVTVAAGLTQEFTAHLVTECGNLAEDVTATATWGSTVPGVADVVSPGQYETGMQGSATITASAEGYNSTAAIVVSAAVPVSLTIEPSLVTLAQDETADLTATVTLTDDQQVDVTDAATWTSVFPTIVEVVAPGQISGVTHGGTEVKATYEEGGVSVTGVCGATVE